MNSETKICQNCKNDFIIEPDDFSFYEKIKVPPPTFCPKCRMIRRFSNYSKRTLYKRECELCKNKIFSMYSDDSYAKVYCNKCWWSDSWNASDYGVEYDFSKSFFSQYKNLLTTVPWMSLGVDYPSMIDSDYCNSASSFKNCYLSFFGDFVENSYYCDDITNSRDCMDCYAINECEKCFECTNLTKCYQSYYCDGCEDSFNIWFSKNLIGCSDCFGCVNLRKKTYCIYNEQFSKEEYFEKIKQLNLNSSQELIRIKEKTNNLFRKFFVKYFHGRHNVDITGDYINNSKNTHHSFEVDNTEDSKYCFHLKLNPMKECFDHSILGNGSTLVYESLKSGHGINNVVFSNGCWTNCRNLKYCTYCISSNDCFGCIGLRSKQYCILNKQYTKEQYEKLVPKIIKHMNDMPYIDSKGRVYKYGEFFPSELSPFAYNETVAQEYFPLTKEQAIEQGYRWKDREERNYTIDISSDDIPDSIEEIDESILNKVIGCNHKGSCNHQCTEAFKIIPNELQFYKHMNLPIPRLCPNCRHYERLDQRNPLKLWHRTCMKESCTNEFETSYAPDKPEIVYCEKCYQQEVY